MLHAVSDRQGQGRGRGREGRGRLLTFGGDLSRIGGCYFTVEDIMKLLHVTRRIIIAAAFVIPFAGGAAISEVVWAGGVCNTTLTCDSLQRYIKKDPTAPDAGVCIKLACSGLHARRFFYYREEGERCNEVYTFTKREIIPCKEFLAGVNGRGANRFYKVWKKDDNEPYTKPKPAQLVVEKSQTNGKTLSHSHSHIHSSEEEICHSH